ncbi:3'-5' exonuclease [Pedobacter sp.]|uniref:3'-5' exonuclease n=1 Tax=Pedobacter sp. TaxID=1411316 RepID=UPI003561EE08
MNKIDNNVKNFNSLPSRHATQEHQINEEKRIYYVSTTRSKNAMYFVSDKPYDFNGVDFVTCQ